MEPYRAGYIEQRDGVVLNPWAYGLEYCERCGELRVRNGWWFEVEGWKWCRECTRRGVRGDE
jgi:hypothetical protein